MCRDDGSRYAARRPDARHYGSRDSLRAIAPRLPCGSIAGSFNGRTAAFEAVNLGSNPSPAATRALSTPHAIRSIDAMEIDRRCRAAARARSSCRRPAGGCTSSRSATAGAGCRCCAVPRRRTAYRRDPIGGGSYVMAPWPGRIDGGRFLWRRAFLRRAGERRCARAARPRAFISRGRSSTRTRRSAASPSNSTTAGRCAGAPCRRSPSSTMASRKRLTRAGDRRRVFPAGVGWHPWFRRDVRPATMCGVLVDADRAYETGGHDSDGMAAAREGDLDLRGYPRPRRRGASTPATGIRAVRYASAGATSNCTMHELAERHACRRLHAARRRVHRAADVRARCVQPRRAGRRRAGHGRCRPGTRCRNDDVAMDGRPVESPLEDALLLQPRPECGGRRHGAEATLPHEQPVVELVRLLDLAAASPASWRA